jgi:NADP-dependent 3-hydroxy acid dehydrogenase YdfG
VNLKGATAIITGASSGIGWATAKNLAEAGANVVVTGRRGERLEALAAELPTEVATLAADIADTDTPHRLLGLANQRFGRADIIINNAAMLVTQGLDEVDLDALSRLISVNFEAVVRSSYVFARAFKAQGSGEIINVSSIGAHLQPAVWPVYAGLKRGLETFTKALRLELNNTGVRVGVIAPGRVSTEIFDGIIPDEGWRDTALEPEDIAHAIRFMLEQPDRAHIVNMLLFAATDPA